MRLLFLFAAVFPGTLSLTDMSRADTGIDVTEGLSIRLIADDDLVPDCTNVSVDPANRVVASGPGYIRLLRDQNENGVFDQFHDLVKGISHGAQGLCFDGGDLYYVADNGVWKVSDSDGDGLVDSKPQQMLKIKTGGEHDAHALRKGPDGAVVLDRRQRHEGNV